MAATLQPKINSDWGVGFVAEFVLTADQAGTSGWTIEFDAAVDITNVWNARIVSHVGTHYVLQGMPYNTALNPGQATVVGIQATGTASAVSGLTLDKQPVGDGALHPLMGVNDTSAVEPQAGSADATFTVWLSAPYGKPVTVSYATQDGTAKAGADYVAASGTLTFAPGETSKTVTVKVLTDSLAEGQEQFTLQLSNPSGAVVQKAAGILYLADATPPPAISVADIQVQEPVAGTATALFTVTLSKPAEVPVTVGYATQDGTAKAGADFVATSGTLTFAPGETSKTVAVTVNADAVVEAKESFSLALSNASLGSFTKPTATATIADGTPPPVTLSVGDVSVSEPANGMADATFTVTLSAAQSGPVSVKYATTDGTAKAGADYTATSGTLTFAAGETSKVVTVKVLADNLVEANESFGLTLSAPTGATIATGTGTATVKDGTPLPTVSVNSVAVAEPATGSANASFTVSLSGPLGSPVTVAYATQDGTAKAGADYTATSGTLTFAAGETSKTVTVAVQADTVLEGNEGFSLVLSNPGNATLGTATGTGTITDGTPLPTLSIGNATVTEPASGAANASFTVTLSSALGTPVTVDYATKDGTAKAGSDFTATTGTITFVAGETSKTITIPVLADAVAEGAESFSVQLSGAKNATIATGTGTGTITDLPPVVLPAISVSDVTVTEPKTGTATASFTVTLDKAASSPVTVKYATADGTAKAGADYTATSGTLTFAAGETSKTVTVPVLANAASTASPQFSLQLSAPSGATLADGTGLGSITNSIGGNAPALVQTITSEWNGGFVAQYSFTNAGKDFDGWTISFDLPGDIVNVWNARVVSHSGTHWVLQAMDYNAEVDSGETVAFGFQAANGPSSGLTDITLATDDGSYTIPGTSTGPKLSVNDVTASEPASGQAQLNFTVSLNKAADAPVTVDYATADGSGKAYGVYLPASGSLTFAPGETSKAVSVTVNADSSAAKAQTFTLQLSNVKGADVADASGLATVLDQGSGGGGGGGGGGQGGAAGFLHTDGNQIVDVTGKPVQINAVNWFGFESANYAPHGLWSRDYQGMMDQMVSLGFNAIRIPYCDQMFESGSTPNGIDFFKNPDLVGLTSLQILDKIVDYAGKLGLKIILDHHRNDAGAGVTENGLWYNAKYPESKVIQNWETLATRYGSNPTVIGADLHNEPHNATWGDGTAIDWEKGAERIGNAVLAKAPDWLIFVEGVETYQGNNYWWGGNLMGVKDHPVDLAVPNRLVYSPHDYPNSIFPQTWFSAPDFPENEPAIFDKYWGYIYQEEIAPILVGEWGSKLTDPKDVLWAEAITDYLQGKTDKLTIDPGEYGPSWAWWSWNPNSGDTGGILKDDWQSVNLEKVELLQPLMYGLITTPGTGGTGGGNGQLGNLNQDLTGSGKSSLVFQHDGGTLWFWNTDGSTIKTQGALAWLDNTWHYVGSGDLDGSGKATVLVQAANGWIGAIKMDAGGSPTFLGSPATLDDNWTALTVRDFDADGKSDVVLRYNTDGSLWLWHMNGIVIDSYTKLGTPAAGNSFAGAGDFNGDGRGDVLWKDGTGLLSVSFSDGDSFTTTKVLDKLAAGQTLVGLGDFGGDGKTDLLLRKADGSFSLWEVSGNIVVAKTAIGSPGAGWEVSSVADYDGDGKADILLRSDAGQVQLWHMDHASIGSQASLGWLTPDWHIMGN